jgi:16S rRNA (guanine527-N7)-methyltransferase
MSQDLRAPLEAGLRALGLDLVPAQVDALMEFQGLLGKWNKVYNLTAVRDPQEMLTHHLLDSLAAVPALQRHLGQMPAREGRTAMLDVGSGGGLPGVVFAICCPQIDVHCVTPWARRPPSSSRQRPRCACPTCAASTAVWSS